MRSEGDFTSRWFRINFPTQQARYEARRDFLNGNPLWVRATSFPHPEYDDRAFYIHDAAVIELDTVQPGPYATIPTADYLQKYAGRRNEHRFEVVGDGQPKMACPSVALAEPSSSYR